MDEPGSLRNPQYPNELPEDFSDYYGDDQDSIHAWNYPNNCAVCHRIEERINRNFAYEIPHRDPFRNRLLWDVVCSDMCAEALQRCNADLLKRHINMSR